MAHRDELVPALERIFAARPSAHWLERLAEAGVPAGLVQTVEEAFADPQTRARQAAIELAHAAIGRARSVANPIRLSETPPAYRLPPPVLGQHTREILAELGMSPAQMDAAEREGAIQSARAR